MIRLARVAAPVLALLAFVPATATAAMPMGIEGGDISLRLNGELRRALETADVKVEPLKPAHPRGKEMVLPLKPEGGFELRYGTGYAFLAGGIRLRAGARRVAIKRLVLNTAKKRLSGVVAGHTVTVATTDEVRADRQDLNLVLRVGALRLTRRSATLLGTELGRRDLFRPYSLLGRLLLAAPFWAVPVTEGSISFGFDEGFRQKLEGLGIAVSSYGPATQLSTTPLTYSFGDLKGDIDPEFVHGGINASGGQGLRLVQAGSPEREIAWRNITINFENGFGGEGSDVVIASWTAPVGGGYSPLGQIEFGSSPSYDESAGVFTGPPTASTLSPFGVKMLNDAFAGSNEIFRAGEPLGTFSFTALTR